MTLQLLRQRDVIGRINIFAARARAVHGAGRTRPIRTAEYNISHILISVPVTASPEQIESREQRAREVYDKAKGGEDFAQLAVAYSKAAPTSKAAPGWRRGPQLPSIIADGFSR